MLGVKGIGEVGTVGVAIAVYQRYFQCHYVRNYYRAIIDEKLRVRMCDNR